MKKMFCLLLSIILVIIVCPLSLAEDTGESAEQRDSAGAYTEPKLFVDRAYPGTLLWPLGSKYPRQSSWVGMRQLSGEAAPRPHHGTDIGAAEGTPIMAAADGIAYKKYWSPLNEGKGIYVIIDHGNGYYTAYAHMIRHADRQGECFYKTNSVRVHAGDIIGYVGNTGSSRGNHLHFEIAYNWNGSGQVEKYEQLWGGAYRWGCKGWEILNGRKFVQTYVYSKEELKIADKATTLEFIDVNYPKVFKINTDGGWDIQNGTLVSNVELESLSSEILQIKWKTLNPFSSFIKISSMDHIQQLNGKVVSIRNLDTGMPNNGVKFSKISEEGDYVWRLTARDKSGRILTLDMKFTAVKNGKTELDKKSIAFTGQTPTQPKPDDPTPKPSNYSDNDYQKVCDVYFPIISQQNDVKKYPFADAENIETGTAGKQYQVVAKYKNKHGNIWYGVAKTGDEKYTQIGYINENNIIHDTSKTNVSITQVKAPSGILEYGKSFGLAGIIKTNESIYMVTASVASKTDKTNIIAYSLCYPNPTDTKVNINTNVNGHNINSELSFGKLPEGDYVYSIDVTLGYRDGTDHIFGTRRLLEKNFTIAIPEPTIDPSATIDNNPTATPAPENIDEPETLPDVAYMIADQFIHDATCTITWLNDDGTMIDKTEVQHGSIPTHATPTKNPIDGKTFVFTGWTPAISAATGDATYTAEYTETAPDTTTATGKCGDNLTWTLSGSTLTISGTGEMYDYEGNGPFRNLGITSAVISNGATSIGNCAFQDCGMLTSISIPDTVTRIGTNAFAYTSRLESISIPDSVTSIGPGAFYECQNLKNVQLPKHLTTINDYTFYRCTSLTGINIPNEVTEIGNNAFYYCNKMTNVTLSNKLKRIGDWAFYACNSLTNITIPDSVTTIGKSAFLHSQGLTSIAIPANVTQIGDNAFAGCRKMTAINVAADNKYYSSIDGVLFNKAKTELIRYPSGRQGEYSVPEGVTTIANAAFYVTPNLTKVTLPESVSNIGRDAFSDCYNLSNATILNKTAQIGEKAFYVYLDANEHWNDKMTVYCYEGSTAHKYAIENNIKYSLLSSDPTVTEAPQTDLYFTYSGEGQDYVKTSNENKEFSVKRAVEDEKTFSLFTGIQVDGKNVDRSNYEATAGSVVIKLKAPYLETLTVGDHVMTVLFTDGKDDIPFTVSAAETPVNPTDPTKFADVDVPSDSFTFKKVWQGDHEDSIDFTLYKADGSVYHHGFDKRVVSKTEWKYNAYFSAPAACYVIEKPVPGYQIKYVNVGVYADVTDRCCDGGTIINKKVPKTGDAADFALWAGIIALGVVGLTTTVILTKRKRAHK